MPLFKFNDKRVYSSTIIWLLRRCTGTVSSVPASTVATRCCFAGSGTTVSSSLSFSFSGIFFVGLPGIIIVFFLLLSGHIVVSLGITAVPCNLFLSSFFVPPSVSFVFGLVGNSSAILPYLFS